ncbi:hypothetical protein OUZ56_019528 [Daphnia magna]|uniref:Fucosyltransferase n=1 Tax=Daphnia magna TaxID=35525 RepID=A0ABQ9ZBU3_9CRUS|nr:hypothetical protein OUZ56_019528 [Daphnia magna]
MQDPTQHRRARVCINRSSQVKICFAILLLVTVLLVMRDNGMIIQRSNDCPSTVTHQQIIESIHENLSPSGNISETLRYRISEINRLKQEKPSADNIRRILFWTSFFNWKGFGVGMGREPFVLAKCRFTNCMTTDDRSLLNQSDALIFHPNDYNASDLPSIRNPDQRYIFLYYEALTTERYRLPIFYDPLPNFFNWTMTYRRDSDVHSTHPYGIIRRKPSSRVGIVLPDPLPAGTSDPGALLHIQTDSSRYYAASANKTKWVAWFTSSCVTPGGREVFFRQMAQYVPIDIYGACGSLKCGPEKGNECDMALKTYKFYIAAENSICPDYVTEKLYRALGAGTVPIVYGGADYSAYAPPYSFIHAADFESPKALADYLILLDRNPGLYSRYFEWTKDWEVVRNPLDGWCNLCEKLNDPVQKPKSYENIGQWWYDKNPCLPGTSLLNLYGLSNEPLLGRFI